MAIQLDDGSVKRSILRDLQSGEAGAAPRIAVSFASAVVFLAGAMFVLGIVGIKGTQRWVSDEAIAITLLLALVAWLGSLMAIWSTFSRWRNLLGTIFQVLGTWAAAIPTSVMLDGMGGRYAEFWIAGTLLLAGGLSVLIISVRWYRASAGRTVVAQGGEVRVNCPMCGYSMVGLHEARCPECGGQFTVDELIRQQDYDALRPHKAAEFLKSVTSRSA